MLLHDQKDESHNLAIGHGSIQIPFITESKEVGSEKGML